MVHVLKADTRRCKGVEQGTMKLVPVLEHFRGL